MNCGGGTVSATDFTHVSGRRVYAHNAIYSAPKHSEKWLRAIWIIDPASSEKRESDREE